MAEGSGTLLLLLVGLLQFLECQCGSQCYERQYNYATGYSYYTYYDYCSFGCCGYTTVRYCCSYYYTAHDAYNAVSLSIGVIVGAIVGGIVFLGVMIAVVICCICKCTEKGRAQRGAVVAPVQPGTTGVSIVNMPMQPVPYYSYQPPGMINRPTNLLIPPPSYSAVELHPAYPPPGYLPPGPSNYAPPPGPSPSQHTYPPELPGEVSSPFTQMDVRQPATNGEAPSQRKVHT